MYSYVYPCVTRMINTAWKHISVQQKFDFVYISYVGTKTCMYSYVCYSYVFVCNSYVSVC